MNDPAARPAMPSAKNTRVMVGDLLAVWRGSASLREAWAEELLDRLTPLMSALSIIFVLVVLSEQFARPGSGPAIGLSVAGWALWTVFATEFVARLVVAPDTSAFWRRNWWQLIFLVLPFLRILRIVRAVRLLRTGKVLSSAVRSTRTARRVLGGRVAWLAAMSAIVVLGSSQLLYGFSDYATYGAALHAAALATVTGEPLARHDGFADTLEVLLAIYSVVVFATLAGSLGAYFLNQVPGSRVAGAQATETCSPTAAPTTGEEANARAGS